MALTQQQKIANKIHRDKYRAKKKAIKLIETKPAKTIVTLTFKLTDQEATQLKALQKKLNETSSWYQANSYIFKNLIHKYSFYKINDLIDWATRSDLWNNKLSKLDIIDSKQFITSFSLDQQQQQLANENAKRQPNLTYYRELIKKLSTDKSAES